VRLALVLPVQGQLSCTSDLVTVVLAQIGHGPDVANGETEFLVRDLRKRIEDLECLVRVVVELLGNLDRCRAGHGLAGCHGLDVVWDIHVVRARMYVQGDETIDIVETGSGFRRTGLAEAALDVPFEVHVTPVKARGNGIDQRGLLPGGEQVPGRDLGEVGAENLDEPIVGQPGIIAQAAPEHPVVPVFVHFKLAWGLGFRVQELASPDVTVGAVVKTLGHVVGDVLDELPHEFGGPPAEVEVVVVAEGPDRLETADVLDEAVAEGLVRRTERVGLGVLETEDEVDVRVIDQGLKGLGNGLGPGLVLAVDKGDLAPGLGRRRVQDALAVGREGPVLFLGRAQTGHMFTGGQADTRQVGIGQEHLFDTLAKVVRGGVVIVFVRQAILTVGTEYEDVPGDHVEIHVAVLAVAHDLPPKGDLLVHGHLKGLGRALDVVQGHLLVSRDAHHGRKRMEVPQGYVVVAEPSQVVDGGLPEGHVPHHQNVLALGIAVMIGVSGGTFVQGAVELDAP